MRRLALLLAATMLGGISSAWGQGAHVQRDWLLAVTAESTGAFLSSVLREASANRTIPPARMGTATTTQSFGLFCRGSGAQAPDILATSRRMPRMAFESCQRAEPGDIIEIKLGYEAVVLGMRVDALRLELTAQQVYRALAAEVPDGDRFVSNRARLWSDIDPTLPGIEIKVMGPADGSPARALFDDLVLQGGCRSDPLILSIFSAAERVARCTTVRRDGAYVAVASGEDRVGAVSGSPTPAVGVFGFAEVAANAAQIAALALDGIVPTYQAVATDAYEYARALYVYVKRAHLRDDSGIGVVPGLRQFMAHVASEQVIGPTGYLSRQGLVALPARERVEQRRGVESLRRFEP